MNHCCDKFKEHSENYATPSAGSWAYAGIFPMPTAQFVFDSTSNNWNINGCCGGGCYVVSDMTHCPFCGAILGTPATMQNTRRGRSCAVMLLIAAGALLCGGAWSVTDGPLADTNAGQIVAHNLRVAQRLIAEELALWKRYVTDVLPGRVFSSIRTPLDSASLPARPRLPLVARIVQWTQADDRQPSKTPDTPHKGN